MYEFVVTCDGGSLGNGSESSQGYGSFMINAPGNVGEIHQLHFGEGVTNNEAEYRALIGALSHIADAFLAVAGDLKQIKLIVRTDSSLVIGQLSKEWKVKASNLLPLVIQASNKCHEFHTVTFEQISGIEMKKILGH